MLSKQHHEAMVAKGFWEEPNLLEKKMLIISELGEAIEAHRKGKVCVMNMNDRVEIEDCVELYPDAFKDDFLEYVKDTYEDELADVVLRIWDFLEHKKLLIPSVNPVTVCDNVGENLWYTVVAIANANYGECLDILYALSPNMDWHIRMKMAYNATRPHKHGKSY